MGAGGDRLPATRRVHSAGAMCGMVTVLHDTVLCICKESGEESSKVPAREHCSFVGGGCAA